MKVPVVQGTTNIAQFSIKQPTPAMIELSHFVGTIVPGSIPLGVRKINARSCHITELAKDAIPSSVTHLYLRRLNKSMVIPLSVTHLVILNFESHMALLVPSTVTHLYIYYTASEEAPAGETHYLFSSDPADLRVPSNNRYRIGDARSKVLFNDEVSTLKREHKSSPLPKIPTIFIKDHIINPMLSDLEWRAIYVSDTHLHIRRLDKDIAIPFSIRHLAILNYTRDMLKYVPKTVTHLYIHLTDREEGPTDMEHYLFCSQKFAFQRTELADENFNTSAVCGNSSFGYVTYVVKRELKSKLLYQ